ncbi:uncharacterized protein RCH25_004387 [Pelodytes ibericus]
MDRLYESLREELGRFEEQVHKCRVNFDLQTVQRVLGRLSEVHKIHLDSWKHIEKFLQGAQTLGEEGRQFQDYLSWLLNYVAYLRTLKNAFDDHVVFPLCDNLYVNDEGEELPASAIQFPLTPVSIAATARQLFHHRRSWALLLTSVNQGQAQRIHGASHSAQLLHSIPDIFEESLVTANLARNWILLHEWRHKNNVASSQQAQQVGLSSDSLAGIPKERKHRRESQTIPDGDPEIQSQVKDTREYMMFLLWRAGRAEALELQVKEAHQKVQSLLQDVSEIQRLAQEGGQENREKVEKLRRELDLEQFRQEILNSDWQLELEVRPTLIRHIETVRERCVQLESSLNTRKDQREGSSQGSLGVLSDPEWDSSSVFSQSSIHTSDALSPH